MFLLFMFQVLLYNIARIYYALNFWNCNMNNKPCPWGRVILEKLVVAQLSNSLPALVTGSLLTLIWSLVKQVHGSHLIYITLIHYYPPIYPKVFQVVCFIRVSRPELYTHLSCLSYVLQCPPISYALLSSL
jgi:hypothetical protein